eukprot:790872-Pleurochrysis_carterae.AAC.3
MQCALARLRSRARALERMHFLASARLVHVRMDFLLACARAHACSLSLTCACTQAGYALSRTIAQSEGLIVGARFNVTGNIDVPSF